MQSINDKITSEGNSKSEPSTVERRIPAERSVIELTMSLSNEPEEAFVEDEADDVNENEDVDAAWSQLQLQRKKTNQIINKL